MVYFLFIKMCIYSIIIIIEIIFICSHNLAYIGWVFTFFIISHPPIGFPPKEHNFYVCFGIPLFMLSICFLCIPINICFLCFFSFFLFLPRTIQRNQERTLQFVS